MTWVWRYPTWLSQVAFHLGPWPVRWYGLAYLAAFLGIAWGLERQRPEAIGQQGLEDWLTWSMLAAVVGGRLGYALAYAPMRLWHHPAWLLKLWQGGMSFHGGLLGVCLATYLCAKRLGVSFWLLSDLLAPWVPLGLGLGRLANFVNGELWGRPTHAAWGMVFPWVDDQLRHPSQLYECLLEGVVLGVVLQLLKRTNPATGVLSAVFLVGYGLLRLGVECFRQPDAQLGLLGGLSMGQWLSLPMVALGLLILYYGPRRIQRSHTT